MNDKALEAALDAAFPDLKIESPSRERWLERLQVAFTVCLAAIPSDYTELVADLNNLSGGDYDLVRGRAADAIETLVAQTIELGEHLCKTVEVGADAVKRAEAAEANAKTWENAFHKSESISDDIQQKYEAAEAERDKWSSLCGQQHQSEHALEGKLLLAEQRAEAAEARVAEIAHITYHAMARETKASAVEALNHVQRVARAALEQANETG